MNKNIRGIVIDPGHGGEDSGAIGNGIYEKDYNLKISKYMYDRFKELEIPVVLTRDSDITLSPQERTDIVKKAFGDSPDVIVISNHLNAGGGAFRGGSNQSFERKTVKLCRLSFVYDI